MADLVVTTATARDRRSGVNALALRQHAAASRAICFRHASERGASMADQLNQSPVYRYDPFDGGLGFSLATRVGDVVFTSGMVGVDANLDVPGELGDEFRQVFANLADVLGAMGTSLDHVVESTNFFAGDMAAAYPAFEEVRKEAFAGRLPASTSIEVARLLDPRYHVEVKLVAAVPAAR